jgi:hypothetical protein
MSLRRINPRLIKIHRTYAIDEAARTLGVHKNTIANWLKNGLRSIDDQRPILIHGQVLRIFLIQRRRNAQMPCSVGELYCLKCRAPRRPLDALAVYSPLTDKRGNLKGRCPHCLRIMCRSVSAARLTEFSSVLTITHGQARPRINDRSVPSLNCVSEDD